MPNYKPAVYRTSGGDQFTIASSGVLEVESGGTLVINSGGTATLNGAIGAVGALSISSQFNLPVETASSGLTALRTYGVSVIYSSGTGTGKPFTLAAATAAGQFKGIIGANDCTSTAPAVVTFSDTLINGRTTVTFSTGKTNQQYVFLVAQNTTNWVVLSLSTNAAIA